MHSYTLLDDCNTQTSLRSSKYVLSTRSNILDDLSNMPGINIQLLSFNISLTFLWLKSMINALFSSKIGEAILFQRRKENSSFWWTTIIHIYN